MIVSPDFKEPGTIPKPGVLGRIARLMLGLMILYFFFKSINSYPTFINPVAPRSFFFWLGLAVSFFALPDVMNIGFGRHWGRKPQSVALLLATLAIAYDILQYGAIWGPALGFLSFALIAYFSGHLGMSLMIQTLFATPG